jgi:environmental stress-induced protein Ves
MLFLLAALTTAAPFQGTDTTVSVRAGSRLELSSTEGGITVQTWNRSAIRVEADHDDDTRVEIDQGGRTVNVRARARYGPAEVTWRLTVPADMALDLSSQSGDVRVTGTKGEVSVSTVEGDITVQGGAGFVSLESVEGDIELSSTSGRITVSTVDGEVTVRGASGDLKVSAVDGDVVLEDIESSNLETNTVDGDIRFSGSIRSGGRYRLSSHDGDVTVTAPVINAEVLVSTFSGDFESDYPVTLTGTQGRGRMSFTLGTGGARLEVESFDGTVALRKGSGRRP